MSMSDLAYNRLPTIGYGPNDFGTRRAPTWDTRNPNGPGAAVGLVGNTGNTLSTDFGASVSDLAAVRARVQVDTGAALRGALLGIAILAALRVAWEVLDDD